MRIKKIHAQEILDSRGSPTLKVRVCLTGGAIGEAAVPSGASTGAHEAVELRDGGKRYGGKGVLKACANVNELIGKKVKGFSVLNLRMIDELMVKIDGTKNKKKIGANAMLGVSLACAHAGAYAKGMPLYKWLRRLYKPVAGQYRMPVPMFNILNGGRHADWAADVQEFMILPLQRKFAERFRCGAEVYHALYRILKSRGYATGLGDEGGFAPRVGKNEESLRLLVAAISKAGYKPGKDVELGADFAASEFYREKRQLYRLRLDKKDLRSDQLARIYQGWIEKYPLRSVEDPFAEDDWKAWVEFMQSLNTESDKRNIRVVGDDLFATNLQRIKKGIKLGAANALVVKPNQIGTLSETIDALQFAQRHKIKIVISHRSGETMDTTIADLAVASGADYIKAGAPSRGERVAKYNRLAEIAKELGL